MNETNFQFLEDSSNNQALLKIGFLYGHPFGKRIINNLINKNNFCMQCGPLCINCRILYPWYAGKIQYAYEIKKNELYDIEKLLKMIEEKFVHLDVLVCIAIPEDILEDIPLLLSKYKIPAVIFPIEDGKWLSAAQQLQLTSEFQQNKIQYAFPRPFCALKIEEDTNKSIINQFIREFRIGYPIIELSTQQGKIQKTQIIRSSPCGATYYIAQYLRNEQLNTWNTNPLEERISYALDKYPCTASSTRDPVLEGIPRTTADRIAQVSLKNAFEKAKEVTNKKEKID